MKLKFGIILFVSLFNFWFWDIVAKNLYFALVVLLLSLLLFSYQLGKKSIFKKVSILILFGILLVSLLSTSFDHSLNKNGELESLEIRQREGYFFLEIPRLYHNRLGFFYLDTGRPFINKFMSKVSHQLNWETYFVDDFTNGAHKSRLPIFYLPLIIIGVCFSLKNIKWEIWVLFALILFISSFTLTDLGPLAIYPFICNYIALGIISLLRMDK